MKKTLSVVNNDVVDVGPQIVKKQKIFITFLDNPAEMHTAIKGYSINGPYFVVQLEDDSQFIYPMANVRYIQITVETVEE